MPTCLLTGATGFLGAHVARALLARGWTVRALVRGGPSRISELARSGVGVVPGDLSPQTDLAAAAAGADAIVHLAGVTKARTLEEYREVNARGTERLARGARRTAPDALFLLVSSQAAAGPARDGRPVAEEDPPRPVSWYGLSKREGEEALAREWPGTRVVIRPSVVFGPGDRGLLVLFRAAARGVLPVPPLLLRLAGAVETARETLTRRSRPFNADKARELLAGDWVCDGGPLSRDLGLPPPPPLRDELAETWAWYGRAGWLL